VLRMEGAQAGGGGRSSSVELSSPPSDPSEHPPSYSTPPNNPFQHVGDAPNSTIRVGGYPDFDDSASRLTSATPQPAPTSGGTSHTALPGIPRPQPPLKEKKPRKKRELNPEKKDLPPRKPRKAAAVTTAAARRKIKPEPTNPAPEMTVSSAPRQAKFPDLIIPHEQPAPTIRFSDAPAPPHNARSGFTMQSEAMHNPPPPVYPQMQPPQQSYPSPRRTSGLHYDPVRSVTIPAPSTPSLQIRQAIDPTPPRPVFRASASPVISSVIEPQPQPINAQDPSSQFLPPTQNPPPPSFPQFPAGSSSAYASALVEPTVNAPPNSVVQPTKTAETSAMDVDNTNLAPASKATTMGKKSSSGTPSVADQSPGLRAKPAPPPLPQGSGLLSSAVFGGETAKDSNVSTTSEAPNIILHVDLKGKSNVVINFARMAEEKYGFEALYPRLAKNRARLAKVAEAGEALEKAANGGKLGGTSAEESGDEDMSVDIDRESDNDGDIAMSGINGGTGTGANSETDGKGTKKRRRRKVEEYDQDGRMQTRIPEPSNTYTHLQMISLMIASWHGSSKPQRPKTASLVRTLPSYSELC
jgi:hypothetical protein